MRVMTQGALFALGLVLVFTCTIVAADIFHRYARGESEMEKLEKLAKSVELLSRAALNYAKSPFPDSAEIVRMTSLIDLAYQRYDEKHYDEWNKYIRLGLPNHEAERILEEMKADLKKDEERKQVERKK